jgi:hypothetical protein
MADWNFKEFTSFGRWREERNFVNEIDPKTLLNRREKSWAANKLNCLVIALCKSKSYYIGCDYLVEIWRN